VPRDQGIEHEHEDDVERRARSSTRTMRRGTVKELEKGAGYRYVEWQAIPPTPRKPFRSCMGKPYVLGDGSI
jgi:hypothetical protein